MRRFKSRRRIASRRRSATQGRRRNHFDQQCWNHAHSPVLGTHHRWNPKNHEHQRDGALLGNAKLQNWKSIVSNSSQTLEAFLPAMKRHNYGHIVSLSSTAGLFGIPNLVPYCCSKYAVRGLMEALYQECRTDKKNYIKFTSIYPYMVDTGLCKKPKIRFENLMPLVKPKEAALEIMNAQRTETNEVTIPRYLFGAHNLCR